MCTVKLRPSAAYYVYTHTHACTQRLLASHFDIYYDDLKELPQIIILHMQLNNPRERSRRFSWQLFVVHAHTCTALFSGAFLNLSEEFPLFIMGVEELIFPPCICRVSLPFPLSALLCNLRIPTYVPWPIVCFLEIRQLCRCCVSLSSLLDSVDTTYLNTFGSMQYAVCSEGA